MEKLILHPLVLDIALDDLFVGVLAYGVHVEATRPKGATPQKFFYFWMVVEDMFCRETFDDLDDLGGREDGDALDEEMHMILIGANLDESQFIPLLNLETHLFKALFYWFC